MKGCGNMEHKTHYKKLLNPNYLGVYALEPGEDLVLTIRELRQEIVAGTNGKKEECPVMYFQESGYKPMIVNATNFKTMRNLFCSPFIEDWVGRKIQLYADFNVRFGNEITEGLRIRPFLPKPPEAPICEACGQALKGVKKGQNSLTASQVAESIQREYGRVLCLECARQEKERRSAQEAEKDVI